jgi:hypothetical protein
MFILVEGLNATGWVDRLAWWLGSGVRGSVWAALFAVGSFSALLANLANNQVCGESAVAAANVQSAIAVIGAASPVILRACAAGVLGSWL